MWMKRASRSVSDRLGFPSTDELIDQLPKQAYDPVARRGAKKISQKALFVPRSGGDDALLRQRERSKRPDIEARQTLTSDSERLMIVLVGLPARGKSIIAHKLERFLNFRGWQARHFSAGNTRRKKLGESSVHASFFDSKSKASVAAREGIADIVLQEALRFFDDGGHIAIFDATNSSIERRRKQSQAVEAHAVATGHHIETVFIESIMTSPNLLLANMQAKVRASPDFSAKNEVVAMQDLRQRIKHYEKTYQSCTEADGSYIKLYDLSTKVIASKIYGRMASSVLPFLMAMHFLPRKIVLVSTGVPEPPRLERSLPVPERRLTP